MENRKERRIDCNAVMREARYLYDAAKAQLIWKCAKAAEFQYGNDCV